MHNPPELRHMCKVALSHKQYSSVNSYCVLDIEQGRKGTSQRHLTSALIIVLFNMPYEIIL